MLSGEARAPPPSRSLAQRARRVVRQLGFFVATMATACWRRGPRGCWAVAVRICGLPLEWLPIESSRRRLSSSMDFLEQFRHGPETQSEWNLLLWRVTFPMIALMIFTLLAVLGKFGHRIYSLLVCPVWYFSQFVLVAHPFLLVFKFHESDASIRKRIWQVLAVLSFAISFMEWFLSSPPDAAPSKRSTTRLGPSPAFSASLRARFLRHSWVVANTVFGVVALIAIPRYFYLQRRIVVRDNHEPLTSSPPSSTTLLLPRSPALTPRSISVEPADSSREEPPSSASGSVSLSSVTITSTTPPTSTRGVSGGSNRPYSSILVSSSSTSALAALKRRSRAVYILTAASAVLVWIAMVSSYSSLKTVEVISKYWFTIYLFSPAVCALLIYVLRGQSASVSANPSVSFDFVAIYSILIVHLPVFLGHLCFRLFTIVELADPAHPAHAEVRGIDFASAGSGSGINFSASTSWMKLGISVVYLLVMQTYFYAMTQVVNAMAEPFAHPSLLYLGQLYYYLFWYVLVGSDTPIDALYWGMLLVNNVHIAFLNTGIYADVKQSSTSCFSTPVFSNSLNMFRGSSMALCFRATTITIGNVTVKSAAQCASSLVPQTEYEWRDKSDPEEAFEDGSTDTKLSLGLSDTDEAEIENEGNDESANTVNRASRRHQNNSLRVQSATSPNTKQKASRVNPGRRRSWSSLMTIPSRSILAFGGGSSAGSATGGVPSSSATIYFTRCTCPSSSGGDGATTCSCSRSPHAPSCTENGERTVSTPPVYKSSTNIEQLRPLYFLMKLAEQDNMADTTALILVPSLLTLLAVLDKPSHGFSIIADQLNLWVRCVFMFAGRMGGAYLAREIFTYKLRSRLRQQSGRRDRAAEDAVLTNIEGVSTRMWIQRLMLQDFHRHFWYLTVVTIVVTFACFERMEVPARFALLT